MSDEIPCHVGECQPNKLPHAECAARVNAACQTYPAMSLWKNLKTGDEYVVFGVGLDASTLEPTVAYMDARCMMHDPPEEYKKAFWWFRPASEFALKFRKVQDPPPVVTQPAKEVVSDTGVVVEESSP